MGMHARTQVATQACTCAPTHTCMCTRVCMHTCMSTRMHMYLSVHSCMHCVCRRIRAQCIHAHAHACVRIHTSIHTRVQICTRACMYMCPRTRPCVSVHAYTCIHTRVHVHTHASTRARVYMYDVRPLSLSTAPLPRGPTPVSRDSVSSRTEPARCRRPCAHVAEGPASGTHSHSQLLPARIFYDDHKLPLQQKDIYFGNLKRADSEDTHCDDAEAVKGTCPTTSRRSDSLL